MKTRISLSILLSVLLLGPAADAQESYPLEMHELPLTKTYENSDFSLFGAGVLRVGFIFKVYAAALYLPEGVSADDVMDNVPKRLEIYYLHRTPKDNMIATAEKTIAKNVSEEQLMVLSDRIDALHAVYEDGNKGGYSALTYLPGIGTIYEIDGDRKIAIEGEDFAHAYFGVWLGENPSSESMKEYLLTPVR